MKFTKFKPIFKCILVRVYWPKISLICLLSIYWLFIKVKLFETLRFFSILKTMHNQCVLDITRMKHIFCHQIVFGAFLWNAIVICFCLPTWYLRPISSCFCVVCKYNWKKEKDIPTKWTAIHTLFFFSRYTIRFNLFTVNWAQTLKHTKQY